MNRFKRWFWLGLAVMVAAVGISSSWAQVAVLRIGVLGEPRGSIANGARLAIEQLNQFGGAGDGQYRLELVVQPVGDLVLEVAVQNLRQAGVTAAFAPPNISAIDLPTLQSLGVPIFTTSLDDTLLLGDRNNIYRARASQVWQGRALANYLALDVGISSAAVVQLDLASTAAVVGFAQAAQAQGMQIAQLLLEAPEQLPTLISTLTQAAPSVIVAYGTPETAAVMYVSLRGTGWEGLFAYQDAYLPAFRDNVPLDQIGGVMSTSTWALDNFDPTSDAFLNDYTRAYAAAPNMEAAAAYDAMQVLNAALVLGADPSVTLPQVNDVDGVQGVLSPARFGRGEISQSAYVNVVTDFGAPRAVARFDSGVEVALDSAPTSGPVQLPTATPDGVTITIVNNIQNVRGGPSINYPILGQLQKDDQARVIGATADNEWVVIDFRGQQGWLATYLLEVFGDLNSVPIITPPPTPTPLPATATPTPAPFPDLVVIAPPSGNFTIGQAFVIQVTVRNQGSVDAGPFAVAITLPSENLYMAQNLPGLAAGQQTITTLSGTLSSVTGTYTSIFIADLNSQVNEGPAGEANNNTFAFTYFVDRPLLSSGSITISSGGTVDLDSGGTIDLLWTGSSLDRQNAATIAIIGGLTYPNSHYDALQPSVITQLTLTSGLIPVGSAVAFVTSEGKRGILRVDAITNGGPLTITYRVYN